MSARVGQPSELSRRRPRVQSRSPSGLTMVVAGPAAPSCRGFQLLGDLLQGLAGPADAQGDRLHVHAIEVRMVQRAAASTVWCEKDAPGVRGRGIRWASALRITGIGSCERPSSQSRSRERAGLLTSQIRRRRCASRVVAVPSAVRDLGDPVPAHQGGGRRADAREPRLPAHHDRRAPAATRGAEKRQIANAPAALALDSPLHLLRGSPSVVAAV